jgi:hypothetical protein
MMMHDVCSPCTMSAASIQKDDRGESMSLLPRRFRPPLALLLTRKGHFLTSSAPLFPAHWLLRRQMGWCGDGAISKSEVSLLVLPLRPPPLPGTWVQLTLVSHFPLNIRSLLTCASSSSCTPRSPPAGNKAAAAAAAKVAEVAEDCGCGPEGGQSLVYVCICMYAGMYIHAYTHKRARTHTQTLTNTHT